MLKHIKSRKVHHRSASIHKLIIAIFVLHLMSIAEVEDNMCLTQHVLKIRKMGKIAGLSCNFGCYATYSLISYSSHNE
jgi:hypothetical protein